MIRAFFYCYLRYIIVEIVVKFRLNFYKKKRIKKLKKLIFSLSLQYLSR
jgi:hypothetical protein